MDVFVPTILSNYNLIDKCPICRNKLDIKKQYIYIKKYKDDCIICNKNVNDSIYCLCEFSENYMINSKIISCIKCLKSQL